MKERNILDSKILIVDEKRSNIALLEKLLKGLGYPAVSSTTDPEKVCELHLIHHYDLIVLNLHLPGMDGAAVMENLRQLEPQHEVPVLMALNHPGDRERAILAGAKDFLSQPFDAFEVLVRVRNVMEVSLLLERMQRLSASAINAQRVADQLLAKLLPKAALATKAAERMAQPGSSVQETSPGYAELTLFFSDLLDFTAFAQGADATVLGLVLDEIAERLDTGTPALLRQRTLTSGLEASTKLSSATAERTMIATHMALDLAEALDRFNARSQVKIKVTIRVGAHSNGSTPAKTSHAL